MEESNSPSQEVLKEAITELSTPVLCKGLLEDAGGAYIWKLLEWNLPELADKFGDTELPFRVGYNARSVEPQWEVNCKAESMTLSQFIQHVDSATDGKKWFYFDYKYMGEWCKDKSDIMTSLNWSRFGFDKGGPDSTLWIGSKGAHTNCHQDSYGCNLVAQIYGRKQWLLFPPSSTNFLHPTRVPYEESTVYSKFNFFSPTKENEEAILKMPNKPKLITLEKGDVLLIPSKWWHYVESLDFSVSVNIWLPIATDNEARVKEAIVKLLVMRIGKKICATSEETHYSFSYCMKLLEAALRECKTQEDIGSPSIKRAKCSAWTAEDLSEQYPAYIKLLPELQMTELQQLLQNKRERFIDAIDGTSHNFSGHPCRTEDTSQSSEQLTEAVVNALCNEDVVNKVAALLLNF